MRSGRYYDPPHALVLVPGLERTSDEFSPRDEYVGGDDAIVVAGIATAAMLPGAPGMPRTSVAFRPRGYASVRGHSPHHAPGFLVLYRRADGRIRAVVTPPAEVVEHRAAARRERELHRDRSRRAERLRAYATVPLAQLGEWAQRFYGLPARAREIGRRELLASDLSEFEKERVAAMFDRADADELERRLDTRSADASWLVLSKARASAWRWARGQP